MDFEKSEEQRLLIHTVERFGNDFYGNAQRATATNCEEGFSRDAWRVMAETGLLALPFSEDAGGLGGKISDLACVMTELGKSIAVEPMLSGPVLTGGMLELFGTDAQQTQWVPRIIDGSAQIAFAHSEKNARYNIRFVETNFAQNGQGVRISGKKTFVLGAGAADAFIISAIPRSSSTSSPDRSEDVRFFLVDANTEGLVQRRYRLTDGSVACELDLTNALGDPMTGGNFEQFEAHISKVKIAACAEMLGVMEKLFESTLDYLKTREQFGKPLSKFQVIQHRMSDLYTSLELSRSHLDRMVAANPADAHYDREIAGSKAFISEAAINIAQEAVQLHGGIGVTDELEIGHGLKRILVLASLFGDAETELSRSIEGYKHLQ